MSFLKVLLLLVGVSFVSCKKRTYIEKDPEVVEVPGPTKEVEVEVEKEVIKYVAQDFESVYYFDNGGYIEMVASEDNEITILDSGFILVVQNKINKTYANFPRVTAENLEVQDNKIIVARNVNYGTTNTYDLEEDGNGANISGNHYTVMTYELQDDLTIKLVIEIFDGSQNNNLNDIIFKRTLRSF